LENVFDGSKLAGGSNDLSLPLGRIAVRRKEEKTNRHHSTLRSKKNRQAKMVSASKSSNPSGF
jgi:hypothetical protein